MQLMKVAELNPHPRNNEFFDDMSGGKWNDFLESVKTSGVIEPIVITEGKVIVSGHQRVRACKELGIEEIMAEIRCYDGDEMKIVKDLIETNVRQRGNIGGSDEQITARVDALKEVYGVKKGKTVKIGDNVTNLDTVCELAGTTRDNYKWAKQSEKVIPEIKELVNDGTISTSVMTRIISKLTPEQQYELAKTLPAGEKVTATQTKEYIELLKAKEESDRKLEKMTKEATDALTSIKLGTDSDAYLDMKKKMDEAEQKYRDIYEERNAESKKVNDLRKQMLQNNEKSNSVIRELEGKLANAEERARRVPEAIVPDDYEELKRKAEELKESKRELRELKAFKEVAVDGNRDNTSIDISCYIDNIRNYIVSAVTGIEHDIDKLNDASIEGMLTESTLKHIEELVGLMEKLRNMNEKKVEVV